MEYAETIEPEFIATSPPAYAAPPAPPAPAAPPTPPVPVVVSEALPPAPHAVPFLPVEPVAVTAPVAYTSVIVPSINPEVLF